MTAVLPDPLAADAVVVNDPASLLVKPAQTSGWAPLLWRRAIRAMLQAEDGREIWAYVGRSRHRIAPGMPEEDRTLRFQFDYGDSVYRALVSKPRLRAVITVDKKAGRIMGVRFLARSAV